MTRSDFISNYSPTVLADTFDTGILPSTVYCVAILESSDSNGDVGQSELTADYNNWFGIEAGNDWGGDVATINGITYRAYGSFEDSLMDFIQLLTSGTYEAVESTTDPVAQLTALQTDGYNPSADYAATLIDIYNNILIDIPTTSGTTSSDTSAAAAGTTTTSLLPVSTILLVLAAGIVALLIFHPRRA